MFEPVQYFLGLLDLISFLISFRPAYRFWGFFLFLFFFVFFILNLPETVNDGNFHT